jgi:hypothetical protein
MVRFDSQSMETWEENPWNGRPLNGAKGVMTPLQRRPDTVQSFLVRGPRVNHDSPMVRMNERRACDIL